MNRPGCRVCDSPRLEVAIDLGMHPWANDFLRPEEVGKEAYYPLRVVRCAECETAQLDYTVPKAIMFAEHTYLSGVTRSLTAHFDTVAAEVTDRFRARGAPSKILDIGSNDGAQLACYQARGWEVLGVESAATIARMANERGVPTVHAFFDEAVAASLGRRFDVVNASGVFFHLEELHSVTRGIRAALEDDGVFVVQFLYMRRIVENLAFDQIYHEHLLYYNVQTLNRLLHRHGLALFDAYLSPIHGGSIIAFATHERRRPPSERLQQLLREEDESAANALETYRAFADRLEGEKQRSLHWLRTKREQGKRVYGMGAPVKGNTLLNYFGIGSDLLECLVELNPLRRGLVSPGMHLPIRMEAEVPPPDAYYVLAWNFRDEILERNRALLARGVEFFFPVEPRRLA